MWTGGASVWGGYAEATCGHLCLLHAYPILVGVIVREPGWSIGTNFGSKAHSDF